MAHSITSVRKGVTAYMFNRNRTHYLKWSLTAEWSIRFIFVYDKRPEYKMSWVLKSHFDKIYIPITKKEAMEYIAFYAKNVEPMEFYSMYEFGKGYRRTVIDPFRGVETYLENYCKGGVNK